MTFLVRRTHPASVKDGDPVSRRETGTLASMNLLAVTVKSTPPTPHRAALSSYSPTSQKPAVLDAAPLVASTTTRQCRAVAVNPAIESVAVEAGSAETGETGRPPGARYVAESRYLTVVHVPSSLYSRRASVTTQSVCVGRQAVIGVVVMRRTVVEDPRSKAIHCPTAVLVRGCQRPNNGLYSMADDSHAPASEASAVSVGGVRANARAFRGSKMAGLNKKKGVPLAAREMFTAAGNAPSPDPWHSLKSVTGALPRGKAAGVGAKEARSGPPLGATDWVVMWIVVPSAIVTAVGRNATAERSTSVTGLAPSTMTDARRVPVENSSTGAFHRRTRCDPTSGRLIGTPGPTVTRPSPVISIGSVTRKRYPSSLAGSSEEKVWTKRSLLVRIARRSTLASLVVVTMEKECTEPAKVVPLTMCFPTLSSPPPYRSPESPGTKRSPTSELLTKKRTTRPARSRTTCRDMVSWDPGAATRVPCGNDSNSRRPRLSARTTLVVSPAENGSVAMSMYPEEKTSWAAATVPEGG